MERKDSPASEAGGWGHPRTSLSQACVLFLLWLVFKPAQLLGSGVLFLSRSFRMGRRGSHDTYTSVRVNN